MSEFISRDTLYDEIADIASSTHHDVMSVKDLLRSIEAAPAVDAVPVVRCRECRHRGDPDECPMLCEVYYGFETERYDRSEDDGFCHRGAKMHGGVTDD